ncbi:ABC transporter permease [Aeromicrobium sp.]|uniref:ABC transporter permease n=1 Tax=Aeromicrobium sp. TaxID=1871063 RepID=UPI0025BC199E|nr:ABC transporter permease [Aeromicrobium sp.]
MTIDEASGATRERRRLRERRGVRQFVANRAAVVSVCFLLALVLLAFLAPLVATHDPDEQNLLNKFQSPSAEHWLGADLYGRDLFSRLVYSSRVTLLAMLQGLAVASSLGITLGLIAGYAGGVADALLSRVSDAIMALPPMILALAIAGILGAGLTNAMIAIGVVLAPPQFRLARGAAQSVASETYIEACRAIGCSPGRILWRHVLPNISSPLLIQTTFAAGVIVIAEASLSFLGLGVQPPQSSWGVMLRAAFDSIYQAPWMVLAPTVMISLTILALSTFGDGLRDSLEGRGRTRSKRRRERVESAARSSV